MLGLKRSVCPASLGDSASFKGITARRSSERITAMRGQFALEGLESSGEFHGIVIDSTALKGRMSETAL